MNSPSSGGPEEWRGADSEMDRLYREEFGLSGRNLLICQESEETVRALGAIVRARLFEVFVSPEQVRSLHPLISAETAEAQAEDLSIKLALQRLQELLQQRPCVVYSDLKQVAAGTLMASEEALANLCFVLGTSTKAVLAEARARSLEGGDFVGEG